MFSRIVRNEVNTPLWSCSVFFLVETDGAFALDVIAIKKAMMIGTCPEVYLITPETITMTVDTISTSYLKSVLPSVAVRDRPGPPFTPPFINLKIEEPDETRRLAFLIKEHIMEVRDAMVGKLLSGEPVRSAEVGSPNAKLDVGPQVFFVLIGFWDVSLPQALVELKVPLTHMVALGEPLSLDLSPASRSGSRKSIARKSLSRKSVARKSSKMFTHAAVNVASSSSLVKVATKAKKFWHAFYSRLRDIDVQRELRNVAHANFNPLQTLPEAERYNHDMLFGSFVDFILDTVTVKKQYLHYYRNLWIHAVPFVEKLPQDDFDVSRYSSLINCVPPENITIEYILYSIVEHVSSLTDSPSDIDLKPHKPDQCRPPLINHKDKILIDTFHLRIPGIDMKHIHLNIYEKMPYATLEPQLDPNTEIWYKCQMYRLWRLADSHIPLDLFQVLIHQVLFTKMYNIVEAACSESVDFEAPPSLFPDVDEFSPEFQAELTRLRKVIECPELFTLLEFPDLNRDLFKYGCIEELDKDVLLQRLHAEYNGKSSLYRVYFPPTGQTLLWFNNPVTPRSEHHFKLLNTPIGFGDFTKYLPMGAFSHELFWLNTTKDEIAEQDDHIRQNYPTEIKEASRKFLMEKPPVPEDFTAPLPDSLPATGTKFKAYDIDKIAIAFEEEENEFHTLNGAVSLHTKLWKWLFPDSAILQVNLRSSKSLITYSIGDGKSCFTVESELKDRIVYRQNEDKSVLTVMTVKGLEISFETLDTLRFVKQKYLCDSDENYRLYLHDGTVLVYMKSGVIHVYYPCSEQTTVFKVETLTKIVTKLLSEDRQEWARRTSRRSKSFAGMPVDLSPILVHEKLLFTEVTQHSSVSYSGVVCHFDKESKTVDHKYRVRAARDRLNQIYVKRTDGVDSFFKKDGSLTVKFPDKTVITSVPVESEEMDGEFDEVHYDLKCTMEHPNYARVQAHLGTFTVSLPATTVVSPPDKSWTVHTGATQVKIQNVNVEVKTGLIETSIYTGPTHSEKRELVEVKEPTRKFIVYTDNKSELVEIEQGHFSFSVFNRFFVINPDLSGYEFVKESGPKTRRIAGAQTALDKAVLQSEATYCRVYETKRDKYFLEYLFPTKPELPRCSLTKYLPLEKVWLMDIPYDDTPLLAQSKFTPPLASLYRNLKSILSPSFRVMNVIEKAINNYKTYQLLLFKEYAKFQAGHEPLYRDTIQVPLSTIDVTHFSSVENPQEKEKRELSSFFHPNSDKFEDLDKEYLSYVQCSIKKETL